MREGWKKVRLEELYSAPSKNGIYKSGDFEGAGTQIVKMKQQFGQRMIRNSNCDFDRLELSSRELKANQLFVNDILFSRTSIVAEGVGKCSIVRELVEPMVFDSNIIRVRLSDALCFPLFYFYYFLSAVGRAQILSLSAGTNVKTIKGSTLKNLKVLLPPLPTQRKIAAILSAYDDLIENNLQRIKLLEEQAQLTYEEWFVRLKFPGHETTPVDEETGLPVGWERKALGDYLVLNYGKALKADTRVPGEFNVYGSSGVVGTHKEALVDGPGIVVGRKGNVGSVFWEEGGFYPIDTVYYVSSDVSLYYIYYELRGQNFINNDAAVPGLNRNSAYLKSSLIPSQEMLARFDATIKKSFDCIQVLKAQNQLLKEARDLLLPRLMMGMIDVEEVEVPGVEQV